MSFLQVMDKMNDGLAAAVRKQFEVPQRKQIIFELLGQEFVKRYFPGESYDPAIVVGIYKSFIMIMAY